MEGNQVQKCSEYVAFLGETKNVYRISLWRSQYTKPLARHWYRWWNNTDVITYRLQVTTRSKAEFTSVTLLAMMLGDNQQRFPCEDATHGSNRNFFYCRQASGLRTRISGWWTGAMTLRLLPETSKVRTRRALRARLDTQQMIPVIISCVLTRRLHKGTTDFPFPFQLTIRTK